MPNFNHTIRNKLVAALVFLSLLASAAPAFAGDYEDAVNADNRKDYAKAVRLFHKLAIAGEANAQFHMGVLYAKGHGVKQNYAEAVGWFRQAALQGHAEGQNSLGVRYEKGQGIGQDHKVAVAWYRKSALQRFALAQANLSDMYAKGLGLERDDTEAWVWATLAVANGESTAAAKRAMVEKRMSAEQLADAQYGVGVAYVSGQGIAPNPQRSREWFLKAATQGHARSQYQIGDSYDKGSGGVAQDYKQAASWFERAAEQGEVRAQSAIGYMYDIGQGVAADPKRAKTWYEKAAAKGNGFAQYNLGSMYGTGRGVERNELQAYVWFIIAEENRSNAAAATAKQSRQLIESSLTPEQVAEGQRLAREWTKANVK